MAIVAVLLAAGFVNGPLGGRQAASPATCASRARATMGYVPSGMSKEQYEQLKAKERAQSQGKNLAVNGVTTFRSRVLDFRAADEAKAMGDKKAYRFPDKETGNKNNYVRAEGGRSSYRQSKEYEQMLKEKEAELKRQREASARISGAAGGFRFGAAPKQQKAAPASTPPKGGLNFRFGGAPKQQKAAPAPEPAKKPGNFFSGLFGGK
ncbi:hypothetical protein KFE25_010918 [Diacronema lutheri]|uniref:Uncharacterized protein n=1 Tax=Diacronema lutheri TaxID=2081491 RepID=A0A8J5X741_DIALT|nr:hypothetical protein KFE25_009795 [Diacronema lutheri]KAG8460863.1 hypothetical protein KFE25_010918 [Diacronema lutheri]